MKTSNQLLTRLYLFGCFTFAVAKVGAADPSPLSTATPGQSRATSAAYQHDGVVAPLSSGVTSTAAYKNRVGFAGQLVDHVSLALEAPASVVNETASLLVTTRLTLNDGTTQVVSPASVGWNILSGPVTFILTNGSVVASETFEDSAASVRGNFAGKSATLNFTVLNTNADNFGIYAADGVDDAWQNQYFGLNNPKALASADPDGDGQTNRFEFTAGLVPTNPNSKFTVRIEPVPGQPTQRRIVFSPMVAGRAYAVEQRANFATGSWQPLSGAAQNDNGAERTVTDTNAPAGTRFYQVKIVK